MGGVPDQVNEPTEPVEFGVWTWAPTTPPSPRSDVIVDVGADGKFADKKVGGDVLVVKLSVPGGTVYIIFDLPARSMPATPPSGSSPRPLG